MRSPESAPSPAAAGGGDAKKSSRTKGGEGPLGLMDGFSPVSPPRIFWNSRKRSANGRSLQRAMDAESLKLSEEKSKTADTIDGVEDMDEEKQRQQEQEQEGALFEMTDRRRALFEPLEPSDGKRMRAEDLLPPPDFETVSYPKGWLVGKRRKLVNVDVVESMRRIAVQEMNRKDREIDGLNEQLEEDGKCLERLQLQLLEERSKRANVEREKAMLENQVSMLMDMLQEAETMEEMGGEHEEDH